MLPKPKFLFDSSLSEIPKVSKRSLTNNPNIQSANYNSKFQRNHKRKYEQNFNNNLYCSKNVVQCDYEGCRFQSTHDEMILHKKINHFQLCSRFNDGFLMDSPEEISKWRAERRSKFPRLSNIINSNDTQTKNNDKQRHHSQNQMRNFPRNHRNFHSGRKFNPNFRRSNYNKFFSKPSTMNRFSSHMNYSNNPKNNTQRNDNQNQPNSEIKRDSHEERKTMDCNSLDLLACYGSDQSDGEENENEKLPSENLSESGDPQLISELIDELIIQVDKITCDNNQNKVKNSNSNNKNQSIKRKKPFDGNRNLYYSQLNLFQKLMLQDVRKVKNELLYCLKLIADTNYLEHI